MNLFARFPLVPYALALCLGIAAERIVGQLPVAVGLTALAVAGACSALLLMRWGRAALAVLVAATAVLGWLLASVSTLRATDWLPEGRHTYRAVVVSRPKVSYGRQRFDIMLVGGRLSGQEVKATLALPDAGSPERAIALGSGLTFTSPIRLPDTPRDGSFDRRGYLLANGYAGQTYLTPSATSCGRLPLDGLTAWQRLRVAAAIQRDRLVDMLRSAGVGDASLPFVAAMVLGERSGLTAEVREDYSRAGASHILALSGLHLAIVYTLISLIASRWVFGRVLSSLMKIAGVWAFVLLSGSSPSVVRAAVMITLYVMVRLSCRKTPSVNTLSFAALVMLLYRPHQLWDIGFQLSFSAVYFIVAYSGRITRLLSRDCGFVGTLRRKLAEFAVVSSLAQLGTAPLALYYFHNLPVYFLVSSAIVIPCATAIIYATVGLLALGCLGIGTQTVAAALDFIVDWMNSSVAIVADATSSLGLSPSASPLGLALVYAAVLAAVNVVCLLAERRACSQRALFRE